MRTLVEGGVSTIVSERRMPSVDDYAEYNNLTRYTDDLVKTAELVERRNTVAQESVALDGILARGTVQRSINPRSPRSSEATTVVNPATMRTQQMIEVPLTDRMRRTRESHFTGLRSVMDGIDRQIFEGGILFPRPKVVFSSGRR